MRKRYLLPLLCCLLLATACDSYLDIRPVGSVIPTTAADFRALLGSAYKKANTSTSRGMSGLRSDEMLVGSRAQNYLGSIEQWNDLAPAPSTNAFGWADFYNVLFIANHVIDSKETITEGSKEEIDQIVGEAYCLRAYMHFILVNLYGQPYNKEGALGTKSIPLKLDTDIETTLRRNTLQEVYASIASDIETARQLITQSKWESMLAYRFNTVSIEAFQSRLSLYMEQWQSAYDAAEKVLAEQPDLVDMNQSSALLPNDFKSVENIVSLEFIINVSYNKDVLASGNFLTSFYGAEDRRLNGYFGEADADGNRKCLKGGDAKFAVTFRTGEFYLNAAEAAVHLNKLPEARARLLQLMEKRYTPAGYALKQAAVNRLTKEALTQEILDERARELAFEGHRWFDLRRTTRPRIEKLLNGKSYVLEQDDARYTIPIPRDAIEANPGLAN